MLSSTRYIKHFIFIFLAFTTFGVASVVSAATIVVDTTNDSDNSGLECSLRDALNTINAGTSISTCADISGDGFGVNDRIEFNIGVGGIQTIVLTGGNLPGITNPVVIDGFTQGGSCGILQDLSDHNLFVRIDAQGSNIFFIESSSVTIRGLDMFNANRAISSSFFAVESDLLITCNKVEDTDLEGISLVNAINFEISKNHVTNTELSGISISDDSDTGVVLNNYLLQNNTRGIHIRYGSINVTVEDNYVDSAGFFGIQFENTDNGTLRNNLVINSGDVAQVLFSNSTNATIENNTIDGGNSVGLFIYQSSNLTINNNIIRNHQIESGVAMLESNHILVTNNIINNNELGIAIISSSSLSGDTISILENSIYNNTGGMGIDIFSGSLGSVIPDGPNVNDILDSDTGANDFLNYPVIYDAAQIGADTEVFYYLDAPVGEYRIEFFQNSTFPTATLHGEGETFIMAHDIAITTPGIQPFSIVLPGITSGDIISSTATERNVATPSTFGSTSEFGNTVVVESFGPDFGDAPSSYSTTATGDGPYHLIDGATYLGSCVDADNGTLTNTTATSDNATSSSKSTGNCTPGQDDEDGVTFPANLPWGTTANEITIEASVDGELNAWIDFNRDGDFTDAGEQIADDEPLTTGLNPVTFDIPTGSGYQPTFARFRFNTAGINGGTITGSTPGAVSPTTFTGSGINDITTSGVNNTTNNTTFRLVVDLVSNPGFETYNIYTDVDGFTTPEFTIDSQSDVTTQPFTLDTGDGWQINWDTNTGHTDGDYWEWTLNPAIITLQSRDLTFQGESLNGEVEDYQIYLGVPPTPSGGGGSINYICTDPEATNYNNSGFGRHKQSLCEYTYDLSIPNTTTPSSEDIQQALATSNPDKICPYFTTYQRSGARNSEVKLIQSFLTELGFYKGTLDSIYGPLTDKAIRSFQQAHAAEILLPWNLTTATGRWYQSTRNHANEIAGCDEGTVTLDNGVVID